MSQLRTERQRLYEVCELACKFFEKQLEASVIGKEAEEYLLKRGITKESIKKWRLGYSPDTWKGLSDFLIGKGYTREEMVRAGLAIEKEGGRGDSYDRFRGRIMFPVFDLNGQVVGFGGRVFKQVEKETAKYINVPQTLLYDKSNILYGLNNAKLAIRKQNQCVVTEGYTDVIMCHQAGYENVVAASGTALTTQHLHILKRYSENLVLAFDMDVAGDSATKRGITNAQEQGFSIKIIGSYGADFTKKEGEAKIKSDPADIILKDPKLWENAVSKARTIMDYYFDTAFLSFDSKTPEGKREIGKIVLPAIKRIPNKIEQSHWIQKLSGMLGVKEEAILDEMVKVKLVQDSSEKVSENVKPIIKDNSLTEEKRKKIIENKIISLILKNPDDIKIIEELQYDLLSENVGKFLKEVKKIVDNRVPLNEGELEKDFKKALSDSILQLDLDAELKNFVAALALRADIEYEEDGQDEIKLCILQLKNIALKNKLSEVSNNIKKAEVENDHKKVSDLIDEFSKLTKEL